MHIHVEDVEGIGADQSGVVVIETADGGAETADALVGVHLDEPGVHAVEHHRSADVDVAPVRRSVGQGHGADLGDTQILVADPLAKIIDGMRRHEQSSLS